MAESILLDDGKTRIKVSYDYGKKKLVEVENDEDEYINLCIPEGIESFDINHNEERITRIVIPSTLNDIDLGIYYTSLNEIEVNQNNTTFRMDNNLLID